MQVLRKKSEKAQDLKQQRDDLEIHNQKLTEDLFMMSERLK